MSEEEGDIVGDIFGWVGTAISTFFYIAPIVPILSLIREELSCKETPGVLLICSLMNCVLWANYGLNKDRFLQYFPNGLGGFITLIYITIFLIYLADKRIGLSLFYTGCLVIVISLLELLFFFIIDVEVTGFIAMVFNVLMFASPGEKMYTVCKTGNYQLIPIWSTIGAAACSGCWLMYGVYLADFKVIIPNGLGIACAFIQAIVFIIFKIKSKNKKKPGEENQEGS